MDPLINVKEDIRPKVERDVIASEISRAVYGLFTIENYKLHRAYGMAYTLLHCKPTKAIGDSLLINREILTIGINVTDIQVRVLHVANEIISTSKGRLDPSLIVIVHSDKGGDEKLRYWGREQGYKVIPIYRAKAGALPTSDRLRRILANDLFSQDPFSVTGPVFLDSEFYGRRNNALETLRQLQTGRIVSIFGIRKIGKTSFINRIVNSARESGTLNVAMIDCSVDQFNKLGAQEALKSVAKAAKMAATRGYAHITEAMKSTDKEIVPVFDDMWSSPHKSPLAVIFDEVDYITPSSPTQNHWATDFNIFWREFRVVFQEAQRMGYPLSVLVSGVSSHAFRVESFDGIENAVLHFIPEGYLAPFARHASGEMINDLAKRCGLEIERPDRERIAEICGDFPYWIRLAGSYIHRAIDIQGRPRKLDTALIEKIMEEFLEAEGSDVARVALEDLRRKTPEPIQLLSRASAVKALPLSEGKLLLRYGLASQTSSGVAVTSSMIRSALPNLTTETPIEKPAPTFEANINLTLSTEEWAEELGVISRRRNSIERKMREFIHFALKIFAKKGENWADNVLKSLPETQRSELSHLSGDAMLGKLYWKGLGVIIIKNWEAFEKILGDKRRFEAAMDLVNDRPESHAKSVDAADIALYRRELTWLEERLS